MCKERQHWYCNTSNEKALELVNLKLRSFWPALSNQNTYALSESKDTPHLKFTYKCLVKKYIKSFDIYEKYLCKDQPISKLHVLCNFPCAATWGQSEEQSISFKRSIFQLSSDCYSDIYMCLYTIQNSKTVKQSKGALLLPLHPISKLGTQNLFPQKHKRLQILQ